MEARKIIAYIGGLTLASKASAVHEIKELAFDCGIACDVIDSAECAVSSVSGGAQLIVAIDHAGVELPLPGLSGPNVVLASREAIIPARRMELNPNYWRIVEGRGDSSIKWAVRFVSANRELRPQECLYGSHPLQCGDLRIPLHPCIRGHPAVVLFHGGFWRPGFERDMMEELAVDLAARGVATWNIDYRSSSDARWPACYEDCMLAFAKLWDIAPVLGVDRRRIALLGHSAGGHLALMAAYGIAQSRYSAPHSVWALAPICDIPLAINDDLGGGAAEAMVRKPDSLKALREASPVEFVQHGVRTFLFHGSADTTVPVSQSNAYVAARKAANHVTSLNILPGAKHMDLVRRHGGYWMGIAQALRRSLVDN